MQNYSNNPGIYTVAWWLFWLCLLLVVYVYAGYPVIVAFIARLKRTSHTVDDTYTPGVTLIIAAYNEAHILEERIKNILVLNYPRDKLEVILASDSSTDRTDEIIRSYASQGIRLNRQEKRRGKTAALNDSVRKARSDILVFSDADIIFDSDDIRMLVRHFSDAKVGCVVGTKKVLSGQTTSASEGLYWKYEHWLKECESRTGSVAAGALGGNFALRKHLYVELEDKTTGEDLVLPLLCMGKGYRVVFEPCALSFERLFPAFKQEFRRKVRIVMGGLHGVELANRILGLSSIGALNLFNLISHKILRWYATLALFALFPLSAILRGEVYKIILFAQVGFYGLSLIGLLLQGRHLWRWTVSLRRLVDVPLYFTAMNAAGCIGVIRHHLGGHVGWTQYKT
jgi:cellulose synthase/poly-beta-1,6-N-acetylglucosamine synthase-like glycosyltransferase